MSGTQLESLPEAVSYFRALYDAMGTKRSALVAAGAPAVPWRRVLEPIRARNGELPARLALSSRETDADAFTGLFPPVDAGGHRIQGHFIAPSTVDGERTTLVLRDGWSGGPGRRYEPSIQSTQATVVAALTAATIALELHNLGTALPQRQAAAEIGALSTWATELEGHLPRLSAEWMPQYADLLRPKRASMPQRANVGRMPIHLTN